MKSQTWSIRKMREERMLSSIKNTYRESRVLTNENNAENRHNGNQSTLSLFLNRVKLLLEEE